MHSDDNIDIIYDFQNQLDIKYEINRIITKNRHFKIFYANVRSIRNKFDDLLSILKGIENDIKNEIDVIVFTESWLNTNEIDFFQISGYRSFHSLRPGRAGGISVYVRTNILCGMLSSRNENFGEFLILNFPVMKFNIIATYRPPTRHLLEMGQYIEVLDQILLGHRNSIIVGDTNFDLLNLTVSAHENYLQTVLSNGFFVFNKLEHEHMTRDASGTILDHVLSDMILSNPIFCIDRKPISDHNVLFFSFLPSISIRYDPPVMLKTIVDYDAIESDVNLIRNVQSVMTVGELIKAINDILIRYTRTVNANGNCKKPWITKRILGLMKDRDKFYKLFKRYPDNLYYANCFRDLKRSVNVALFDGKTNYYKSKLEIHSGNTRKFWDTTKEMIFGKTNDKTDNFSLRHGGSVISDPSVVANSLNRFFINVANDNPNRNRPGMPGNINLNRYRNIRSMDPIQTCQSEIEKIIDGLNASAANGYDSISVNFFKKFKTHTAPVLARLINESFSNGVFPNELKIARVKPIFKGGDPLDMNNYRPISVLSSLSKIFEAVLKINLERHFLQYAIIDPAQFGFINRSSTLSACSQLVYDVQIHRDSGEFVSCVFVDLRKAFDCVDHTILLDKLKHVGVGDGNYEIFASYLSGRRQFIEMNNLSSMMMAITSGIPQGSLLGPLLFNFYVNDLFHVPLNGKLQMYADDTVLTYHHMDYQHIFDMMNEDLNRIGNWLSQNSLSINAKKTQYIVFDSNRKTIIPDSQVVFQNNVLKMVGQYEYLGLIIDSRLSFAEHVDRLKRRLIAYTFVFRRIRHCLTINALWSIYNAFILSRIIYLNPIWSCASRRKINELRIVQNKIIKSITNRPYLTPSASLYNRRTLPLEIINQFHAIFYIFKIKHNLVKQHFNLRIVNNIHGYPTRQADDFFIETFSTNRGRCNFLTEGVTIFNSLPTALKSENVISRFKRLLLDFLCVQSNLL
jgi:Reverse transcriptase (RNA-dependent DNA polymerase)